MHSDKTGHIHGFKAKKRPQVSVGLPVYNGQNYLEETLKSILGQSFDDFELIISDNASTDETERICREFAARDHRIRYFRNPVNIGIPRNFNRTFALIPRSAGPG
jgi:glycosyltransferase involved in cell wall biosynthesis